MHSSRATKGRRRCRSASLASSFRCIAKRQIGREKQAGISSAARMGLYAKPAATRAASLIQVPPSFAGEGVRALLQFPVQEMSEIFNGGHPVGAPLSERVLVQGRRLLICGGVRPPKTPPVSARLSAAASRGPPLACCTYRATRDGHGPHHTERSASIRTLQPLARAADSSTQVRARDPAVHRPLLRESWDG